MARSWQDIYGKNRRSDQRLEGAVLKDDDTATGLLRRAREALGDRIVPLERSLTVYYGDSARDATMDVLYRTYLRKGDLAFDIGSHVGDRIGSFRRLGARVVALEPQPLCVEALQALYGDDPEVTLLPLACGARAGSTTLYVNRANPTVTTASRDFIKAAEGAVAWHGQIWDSELTVQTTTLDALVAKYGRPAFAKIDVEGFEAEVLDGLTTQTAALSFEFTTIQKGVAFRCLERLVKLGYRRFNVALGETQTLHFAESVRAEEMRSYLANLPEEANSGDVYAEAIGNPPFGA
jgi:FkbM family methyltransferase